MLLKVGGSLRNIDINYEEDKIHFRFAYNELVKNEIKSSFSNCKWNPVSKVWTADNNQRAKFILEYMTGKDPYLIYDKPLIDYISQRTLYTHQAELVRHILTRKCSFIAAEMGTGKSLAAIEAMEYSGKTRWWYCAPKSALESVKREFRKWGAKIYPQFMTYDELIRVLKGWVEGVQPPEGLICDESSRLKNPNAQRTKAAQYLADNIRNYYDDEAYVVLMSGSPAPKSPWDWWSQLEIVKPGFLKEGNYMAFQNRLSLIKMDENTGGVKYPKLITHRDSNKKCHLCGKFDSHEIHKTDEFSQLTYVATSAAGVDPSEQSHKFVAMTNEVELLYKRLDGPVIVKWKKDCFSGDTLVLTKNGPKRFDELAKIGKAELYVKTQNGMKWLECPIRSFGIKDTFELTFGDNNKVNATFNHEWLTVSRGVIQKYKKFTYELIEQKTELPLAEIKLNGYDEEGYAHGFVFGDGTIRKSNLSTWVPLYDNDIDLLPLLKKFGNIGQMKRRFWDTYIPTVNNLPYSWKELPEESCSKEYALGFILGLTCADGRCDEGLGIYQANISYLKYIRLIAIKAGLRCSPIYLAREFSDIDNTEKPLYYFSYQTYNLKKEWVLRKDYQKKMTIRKKAKCTTIKNINWIPKSEEAFCAIVPKYHNFTLANGIITGNCLDLPEKVYIERELKTPAMVKRTAKLLTKTGVGVAQTLILMRELSDGFQYHSKLKGSVRCEYCRGAKKSLVNGELADCVHCSAKGFIKEYEDVVVECETPKIDALLEDLDANEEIGRLIVYAGFTASIDRICAAVKKAGWHYIRIDGRGWTSDLGISDPQRLQDIFQEPVEHTTLEIIDKIAIVGHPGSAGMGLTLTAAINTIYYSNDFNQESRGQSEDRTNRPSSRGTNIIDYINLPVDRLIIQNLRAKKNIQAVTMGQIEECLND